MSNIRHFNYSTFVYSESTILHKKNKNYYGAKQILLPLKANGWQSILYDAISIIIASLKGGNLLILGTSGTFILPFVRFFFPSINLIVNMAGLEWKRSKWSWFASKCLKFNEWSAVRFSHILIADNQGLVQYVREKYKKESKFIPYGGNQFSNILEDKSVFSKFDLPDSIYDFAICRAQPDNNIDLILEAYSESFDTIIFVSNWNNCDFGRRMIKKYSHVDNIFLIGPIYDSAMLKALRTHSRLYIHGHSAGGTNPSLVEAMWAQKPIFAFDVCFHKFTTYNNAMFFDSSSSLVSLLKNYSEEWANTSKELLYENALQNYNWEDISNSYLKLLK